MKNKSILKISLVLLFSLTMIFVSSAYAPGDVDQNGMVSLGDVLEMMRNVGSANVTQYDLDGDGYVLLKDVLLLLDGVITPAKDAMTKLDVTTSTFGFTNGTWSFANGVAHGKNASVGDRYAMTDIYVEDGQAFTFEATIEFVSGTAPAAGIVFGVKNQSSPSSAWYCANVAKNSNPRVRLFSVGTGTVGTNSAVQRPLTAEEKNMSVFDVRISVKSSGEISYFVNGELIGTILETQFPSGYIGIETNASEAKFSNISYNIENEDLPVTKISISGGDTKVELSNKNVQSVDFFDVDGFDGTLTLNVKSNGGQWIYFDGKLIGKGSADYTFVPKAGKNTYEISFESLKGEKTVGILEINASHSDGLKPLEDSALIAAIEGGRWTWEDGILVGNNADLGDRFALSNIFVGPGVEFTIEADITHTSGSAAFVFGTLSQTRPSWTWYGANITKSSKRVSLFSSGVGTIGGGATSPVRRTLTADELEADTHRLGLHISENGEFTLYLNNEVIGTYTEENYRGGYIGFNTNTANAKFSNIFYRFGEIDLPYTKITATVGDKINELLANSYYQKLTLTEEEEAVVFKFTLPEGYTLEVDGEKLDGYEYTCNADYGITYLTVTAIDGDGKRVGTHFEIWRDIPDEVVYTDPYRPQYHYTPKMNYSNDPNGLVYNAASGEYHMYYQYNANGLWGGDVPKTWALATSTDLVNWREKGIALDVDGTMFELNSSNFSGSCVVDYNNTSGFFNDSIAPEARIIAVYTSGYPAQMQCIAYSLDGGYSFIKYDGNPVITKGQHDGNFRDPKVYWIEDETLENGGTWLMVVAGGYAELYTSPDLKNWTFNSTMCYTDGNAINTECPDIFIMPLDGDANNIKYVMSLAGQYYVVGDLVKNESGLYEFVAEQERIGFFLNTWSTKSYAAQSFFGHPDGKIMVVNWLRDWNSFPIVYDKYWQGVYSMAHEMVLKTDADGVMRLHAYPVEIINDLRGDILYSASEITLSNGDAVLGEVTEKGYVIDFTGKLSAGASANFKLRTSADGSEYILVTCAYVDATTINVTLDTTKAGPTSGANKTVKTNCNADGSFDLQIFVDNGMIEVFTHDGQASLTDFVCPDVDSIGTSLTVSGGTLNVKSVVCQDMNSIWQ